jgi:hypothetical protein
MILLIVPLQTGMAMLPLALFATTGNLTSARLAHMISPMGLMIAGAAFRLIGFAGVAVASAGFSYPLIALPLLLIGFGSGLSNPMAISVMLSTTDKKYSGITSGISTAGVNRSGDFRRIPRGCASHRRWYTHRGNHFHRIDRIDYSDYLASLASLASLATTRPHAR